MKSSIILLLTIFGATHAFPTLKEIYGGAKVAIGLGDVQSDLAIPSSTYFQKTPGMPSVIDEEEPEVTTSKYSLRAVVNRAKTYIPSPSSLVPRFSYKDGTLSYSWTIFHFSGGIHRLTTTTTTPSPVYIPNLPNHRHFKTTTAKTPFEVTHSTSSSEEETVTEIITSNTIRNLAKENRRKFVANSVTESDEIVTTANDKKITEEEINTDYVKSSEEVDNDLTRSGESISWKARSNTYDEEFPPLPTVDIDLDSGIETSTETNLRRRPTVTPSTTSVVSTTESFFSRLARHRNVTHEDVIDFWQAERYLGDKLGKPFYNYLMDHDML